MKKRTRLKEPVSGAERKRGEEGGKKTTSRRAAVVHPLTALGSLSEWLAQASEHNKQPVMTHPGLWGEDG